MRSILNDKVITFSIFYCFISAVLCGQSKTPREKYITAGFNAGYLGIAPVKVSSASGTDFNRSTGFILGNNGRNQSALTGTSSLGLTAGFLWQNKKNKNMNSINASFQHNRNSYVFDLPFKKTIIQPPVQDNDSDDTVNTIVTKSTGKWIENDKYLTWGISLQHFHYVKNHSMLMGGDKYRYVKLSFGQSFLHRNGYEGVVKTGLQSTGGDEMGNQVKAVTISAHPVSNVIGGEIGLRSFSEDKNRSLDIGIAWFIPFSSSYTRAYDFYQNTAPAAPVAATPHASPPYTTQPNTAAPPPAPALQQTGHEEITFKGGSILLNVTYNFNSHITRRPPDTTAIFTRAEPHPPVVHEHRPRRLEGRRVKLQERIHVGDSIVVASVWDKGIIDGDRITLYLNGVEILHDYTVGKSKKEITLHLVPGKNFLVMHALNLGRIPPNTAALEVNDGDRTQKIILNSDMRTSGAVELICKPPAAMP